MYMTIIESRLVRRVTATVVIVLAASCGALLASGALASTAKSAQPKRHRRSGLAVLSSAFSGRRARIASANGVHVPPGAVLAAASGKNAIYVWQPTAAEETPSMQTANNDNSTCMVEVLNVLESIVCGPTATVEDRGIIGINLPSSGASKLAATALVPNGVSSVTVTEKNGSARTVAVTNNAVLIEDPNIASVSFTLPNGEVNSATVDEAMATRPLSAAP